MLFDFFKKKLKGEPAPKPAENPTTPAPEAIVPVPSVAAENATPATSHEPVTAPALESEAAPEIVAESFSESETSADYQEPVETQSADLQESAVAQELVESSEPVVDAANEITAASPEVVEAADAPLAPELPAAAPLTEKPQKLGFFARIKQGLARTSSHFAEGLGNLFLGRKTIDDDLFEELETQLLIADVGMDATTEIIDKLTQKVARKQLNDGDALYAALREELAALLKPVEQPLEVDAAAEPYVILVVGVNGVGKTTTIGKLAKRFQNQGKKVMLAAGDTFRAAAVEQLQVWGERNQVPVIAQHTGADSASIIYDALQAAKSRKIDVIIADTAGRLHNKSNLMEELSKVKRVMAKLDASAPHEVLLVLDAGTGQNAINQAEQFRDAAGVTGIALTKLDGTAKGGVIFALSKKLGLPIRFIGVGEGIDDLQPFAADAFVSALFDKKID